MQSVLKTFRLPKVFANFIEQTSDKKKISQTDVIIESLQNMINEQKQWEEDLKILSEDKKYKKEQINLAEENYE